MIHSEVDLTAHLPFTRATAAEIANAASHYECRLTLESDGVVLNAKSMLGLLSQTKLPQGRATLVADGVDEQAATAHLVRLLG